VDLAVIYFAGGATLARHGAGDRPLADRYGKQRVFTILALISIGPILVQTHLPPLPLAWVVALSVLLFVFVPGRLARHCIGHGERRADPSGQLHELQRVAPATRVGNRVARGGTHHRARTRWHAHALRHCRLAVGRLHVGVPVARRRIRIVDGGRSSLRRRRDSRRPPLARAMASA
jgi:hypothetical protein